ncbi:MAG: hypothetical protein WCV70_01340 [Patescibacteria group bacterium]|jgi:amino acid transporter
MIYKSKKFYLAIILFFFVFLIGNLCFAGLLKEETKNDIDAKTLFAGSDGGYDTSGDLLSLIQIVINAFLSVIGVVLLTYMLYAGYNWMTAQGEEAKVEKAKDTLKRAIVGVIIIVAAYAISVFVMARIEVGTLKGAGSGQTTPAPTPQPE